jgi:peptide/nickel transport system substrate-binding protein
MSSDSGGKTVDRRDILRGLASVPAVALAGCTFLGGDDGNGDDNGNGGDDGNGTPTESEMALGERVPSMTIEYMAGQAGRTAVMEELAPRMADDLSEIGISAESRGRPNAEVVDDIINDRRAAALWMAMSTSSPDRLDPQEFILRETIGNAGQGGLNLSNWPNCEYSQIAFEQDSVNPDQRRELVDQAFQIAAEDYAHMMIVGDMDSQLVHSDSIEVNAAGDAGIRLSNPVSLIESRPTNSDEIRMSVNSQTMVRKNWMVQQQGETFFLWNALIFSPLVTYDENYELTNSLASGYTTNEDATQVTVTIEEDATFHNGDPVTAEHVKFTFEFLQGNSAEVYKVTEIPFESIDVVDDKTVEFNFESPYPIFVTRDMATFGILHKDQWESADGDAGGFQVPDDVWGSGPFELATFQADQSARLTAFDGHPNFQPDHDIVLRGFEDETSAVAAFEQGSIELITLVTPNTMDRLDGNGDVVGYSSLGLYGGPAIYPQIPMPSVKYKPIRQAIGAAINRQQMNEVVLFGQGSPQLHSLFITQEHPWFPEDAPQYTDDPSGDVEAARQVLEDAGWGWDGDGRLHFPEGADTSPMWPAEGQPSADDFPCVNADGEYSG